MRVRATIKENNKNMTILVFDIETIPDVNAGKTLHDLHGLSDADAATAMFTMRRIKTGHEFLPHYQQRIVAISLFMSTPEKLHVWSLGQPDSDEKELVTRFFQGIDKHTPTLVSWNGSGFDLPVLHYRALLHGISAPTYWEQGDTLQNFRWNNYLNRFHFRHLDLMDVLSGYQNKAVSPLDAMATLIGFPGKMGMSGSRVWDEYQAGNIEGIRQYCETDVLNTYGVYLRFELMRGNLDSSGYNREIERLKAYLSAQTDAAHLQAFLQQINVSEVEIL